MKKISTLLASLPLITTACGGGGGSGDGTGTGASNTDTLDLSQEKGIWSNTDTQTFTSPSGNSTTYQASTGIVTSQEQLIILTGNSDVYIVNQNTKKAYYFRGMAFLTEITSATASETSGLFKFNFYNEKRKANEQISLPANGHYNVAMNLSSMIATWDDEYNGTDNWSFDIQAGGVFRATRSGDCIADGTLSHIDASKSELAVSVTFNNNCGTNLKNTHTGLAWPDELSPTTVLNMAVYSSLDGSGKAIGWKLRKL